jgi:hypothetical protein
VPENDFEPCAIGRQCFLLKLLLPPAGQSDFAMPSMKHGAAAHHENLVD